MADNRLQMIAELIDKVSPAAKKMEQAFKNLQNAAARDLPKAFKQYQNAVNANEKALQNYGKRSESVRREVRAFLDTVTRVSPTIGRLTESIGAFATGSGAAVGAIGAVGAALVVAGKQAYDFAESMKQIKFASAESGLAPLQVNQMRLALGELGFSSEETTQTFVNLKHAMDDAARNTQAFENTIAVSKFREWAQPIIKMASEGKTTSQVFEAIADQVDRIKDEFKGPTGVDIAGRYLEIYGIPSKLARSGGRELRERLAVIEKMGTTASEMREAQEQAELLRKRLFEGRVILDKWRGILQTDITNAFLGINNLLDSIDKKYNAFFGGGGVMRKLIGPNTYDQMFPPSFGERFGTWPGTGGGGGGGAAGETGATRRPGPQFRKGVGPGARFTGGGGPGKGGDPRGLEGYIREQAAMNHIDPDVAMAVARSEGLSDPVGDHGKSHGAFQLYTGGGLGNDFQKETGLDPADPTNERATIAWAMKYAGRTKDWGPWHGAARVGVGRNQGFNYTGGPGGPGAPAPSGGGGGFTPAEQMNRPIHTGGTFEFKGQTYRWGSGGIRYGSIPYGDYPVGTEPVGPVGQSMGAIGLGGTQTGIDDPQFGRRRFGIELHSGMSDKLLTEGCIAVAGDKWRELKAQVLASPVPLYFHHTPRGMTLDTNKTMAAATSGIGGSQSDRANMNAALSGAPTSVNGTGKIDVNVGVAASKTERSELFKRVHMRRHIQMQPSDSGPAQTTPFA